MAGTPSPSSARQFMQRISKLEQAVARLARCQQLIFTDPTEATGDPANGYATVVIGSLSQICGISAFGLAVWNQTTSTWSQVT